MFKSIISFVLAAYYKSSSTRYIKYLRKKGMKIGKNSVILSPNHSHIDVGRASWIEIGDNCVLTYGISLIAHDYSWSILRKSHGVLAPTGGGGIKIGNNVFIGVNSIVLRNVSIGNNCIIGAGSVVCNSIPDNSVATGNPCKVILSLDEFCEKRKKALLNEATQEALHIMKVVRRNPTESELARFGFLFNLKDGNIINRLSTIGDSKSDFIDTYKKQDHMFENFESFIEFVKTHQLDSRS